MPEFLIVDLGHRFRLPLAGGIPCSKIDQPSLESACENGHGKARGNPGREHTGLFDFSTIQTWIWFVAYGVYPVIALWVVWAHRSQILAAGAGGAVPGWVRAYLLGQAILLVGLAAALFVAPSAMADVWPWPITDELAQQYSAPFLSFGIGSLLLGRMGRWSRMRTGAITMAVFAVGVLTASYIHRSLFSLSELPDQLWFGLFALGAAALRCSLGEVVQKCVTPAGRPAHPSTRSVLSGGPGARGVLRCGIARHHQLWPASTPAGGCNPRPVMQNGELHSTTSSNPFGRKKALVCSNWVPLPQKPPLA